MDWRSGSKRILGTTWTESRKVSGVYIKQIKSAPKHLFEKNTFYAFYGTKTVFIFCIPAFYYTLQTIFKTALANNFKIVKYHLEVAEKITQEIQC